MKARRGGKSEGLGNGEVLSHGKASERGPVAREGKY